MTSPATYTDMAEVINNLPALLRKTRRERRLAPREAAAQTNVPALVWQRIENGAPVSSTTLVTLLQWMDTQ